jgi:hypothetical protein
MDQQFIGVALHARGSAMFRTELNLIVELTNLRKRKAILDADRASHTACAPNSDDDQQIDADINFYEDELTSLGGQRAAELATDARGLVAAAMEATSADSAERLLFITLLDRIDAEIANHHYTSGINLQAQPPVSQTSLEAANSSPSFASEVTAQCPASSSSDSTQASSAQLMSSPESDLETDSTNALLRQELATRVRGRVRLAVGAPMTEKAMRDFAFGKIGLSVVKQPDGHALFEVKVGRLQPVAVYKALAPLINEAYVDGTTKNKFDSTDSAEAWALAQLVSEYRNLVRGNAPTESKIQRQL